MTILNALLQIIIFSGIIFFATLVLKRAFKNKMSPLMHFAVWAVFLLRLIVPVTLDAPIHFFTYATAPVVLPAQASLMPDEALTMPHKPTDELTGEQAATAASPDAAVMSAPVTATPASAAAAAKPLTTDQIVLIVWLGGTVLGFSYIALLAVLLARKVAAKSAPASVHLQSLLAEVKDELQINARLHLLCQYECGSPALLFPRTILMPMDKLAAMDDEQIKNCLRHECMHYKRGDHLTSLLLTILNAVYWFNPFMWLAYYEIRKDMETACDGAVVHHLSPGARRSYAELILSLSGNARQIPMVLPMARSKSCAERRVKGVFMAQTSKRSVKFVSVMLALVLLLCCFTTACQPTPAKPVVVNKSGGISGDMIADPLAPGAVKDVDAPQHWKETMTRLNGHMLINADTDVTIPASLSDTPVYKVEQAELSLQRLKELTHYFAGNSRLYMPLPMTSFEGLAQLKKIKDSSGIYGELDESARKSMTQKLQQLIDDAAQEAKKTYTELSYTQPYNSENTLVYDAWLQLFGSSNLRPQGDKYVDVYAETGEDYEPMISASTYDSFAAISSSFTFAYPGSFLTADDIRQLKMSHEKYNSSYYKDNEIIKAFVAASNQQCAQLDEVMSMINDSPEMALATAQKTLDDLGIDDLSLDFMDKGAWLPRHPQEWDELSTPVSQAQGGYSFVFSRNSGGLVGFQQKYSGMSTKEMLSYTTPFHVEQITVFISNGKVLQFDWRNMANTVEMVASNTNLLPFSEIKERLADYLSYNFSYDGLENGSFSIEIVDAQLRASQITAKDDPSNAWLVPSWVFRIRQNHDKSDNTSTIISGDYPCEINALDGGIIIPMM